MSMLETRTPTIALALGGLLALFGCKSDDSDDTGATTHDHDHGAETSATATATATDSATVTATATDSATVTATDSATVTDSVTATGSTTDDHGAEEHGADEHGADEGHDHSIDTDGSDPIVAYCMCMLINCHDQYHGTWGEDHIAAEEACMMAAEAVPQNGSPTEEGNFLECRQHFCDAAVDDPAVCENAIGNTVCI